MKLRVPFYYDNFKCTAASCRDNCCLGGWQVDIDEDTYRYYQTIQGEFGDKLRASIIKTDAYCFKPRDGRCPLLSGDGLCELHCELGEQHLGVVCRQFPRFSEYYGMTKETGIGLACEEAARIVLSSEKAFEMTERECSEEYTEDEEYNDGFAEKIFQLRDYIFALLERDDLSLHESLIVMLALCADIQEIIKQESFVRGNKSEVSFDKMIDAYKKGKAEKVLKDACRHCDHGEYHKLSLKDGIRSILYVYEDMEVLNPVWEEQLKKDIDFFHETMHDEEYNLCSKEFLDSMKNRMHEYKNFVTYLLFRYFAKSVYDYNVLGKAQLMIVNFLVMKELDMLRWTLHDRQFSFDDMVDIAHIFSRQVEYSEENIEMLYEGFMFDKVFSVDYLTALLFIDSQYLQDYN